MSGHRAIKTGALSSLQQEKYQTDTLMLNLELDTSNTLTATISFFTKDANNTASKQRNRQVMAALNQQQPGDILHKGLVAAILLPFVAIGKAAQLEVVEHDEPRVARACGVVAHSVLQSIKYLPNAKATGFFSKKGMIALKLENFELPNEGFAIWPASGKPIPCIFGLRVLEKIQLAQPAIMASLDEDDQEDLEAGLQEEMVDDLIDEYASAKHAAVEEKKSTQEGNLEAAEDQVSEVEKQLQALKDDQATLKHHRQCQVNQGDETWDETQQRNQRLKASLEQIEKKKDEAETALGQARYKVIQTENRQQEVEVEETLDDEFLAVELDLELFLAEEPSSATEIENAKVEKAQEAPVQPAQQKPECEVDIEPSATRLKSTAEATAQPRAPQVAGKKRSREDTEVVEDDGPSKKSKTTPLPMLPPSQTAGVKRSREEDKLPEVTTKKARLDAEPSSQASKQVSSSAPAALTKGHSSTVPKRPSKLRNQIYSNDETASGLVDNIEPEISKTSIDEAPKDNGKGKAKLPTPPESSSPEAPEADSIPSPPAPGVFSAPISTAPSELDLLAQAEYHKDNLNAMNIKQLRPLLKEWGYAPPKGSGGLSNLRKPECVRVVQEALKARRKKQAIATETARRQGSGSMSQRAGISSMQSAYVRGSGGRRRSQA